MPTSNRRGRRKAPAVVQAPPTRKVITLVKLKQWYIPYDKESYRTLRRVNLANVRYHEDFIETIQLVTRPRGIRAKCLDFAVVYRDFMTKLQAAWLKSAKRKIKISRGSICLESKDLARVKTSFPEVEACIRRFFTRWGFKGDFAFSESPTKAKLQVTFAFNPRQIPVIEFLDD